jgi:pyruvate dehydrogenase E2 component (dihydrolipoamide acetyltransferase)
MPKLSDSMEIGTIITWLIADGSPVVAGDELVEIETDKAAVTHLADADGVLQIVEPEGTTCAVGTIIARIGPPISLTSPAPETVALPQPGPVLKPTRHPDPGLVSAVVPLAKSDGNRSNVEGVVVAATPLARRAASIHGVRLETVRATGPRGRVTQSDVLTAAGISPDHLPSPDPESTQAWAHPGAPNSIGSGAVSAEKGQISLQPFSRLQQVVAERMAHANATTPAFQVQTDVTVDDAIALRERLKELPRHDRTPTLNDLVIKASAVALRDFPLGNASFTDVGLEFHSRINVGFAVAAEGSLMVPTIFDADTLTLGKVAAETRRLAERVRSATITPAELSGGTFTVSNLGMFGMTAITPVINPPQAGILGVGAARQVLTRAEGEIVERTMITLTLSCDHRILYGADAATLLAAIRELLENPLGLLL